MSDELDRAVDARIDCYRPESVPPFAAIEGRKRGRDRQRVAVGAGMILVAAVAGVVGVLPSLTADGDRLTPGQADASPTAPPDPSPYPYTDCDAVRPGDPLDFTDLTCAPQNVTQVQTMDCIDGIYVHLVRPGGRDLEGLVGRTPVWREAAPVNPTLGRTPWAFENCQEHG